MVVIHISSTGVLWLLSAPKDCLLRHRSASKEDSAYSSSSSATWDTCTELAS